MNRIDINGVIGWEVTAAGVREQLSGMTGPLAVYIDTPGGSVFEGVAIHNMLADYEGEVTTYIIGLAASMGSYIALAGDKVMAYDNATYMIHNAWFFTAGDHNQLRQDADHLEAISRMLGSKYVDVTGMPESEVIDLMDATTYYYGNEIVDAGFASGIVETGKNKDKASALALSKERFRSCEAKMREHETEERERMVALFEQHPRMKQFENKRNSNEGSDMELHKLTLDMLKDQRPDIVAKIEEGSRAKGFEDGKAAGVESGAKAEQERIAALDSINAAGYEGIIAEMKADSTKTANDAKLAIFDAQQEKMKGAAGARSEDGATLAAKAASLSGQDPESGADKDEAAVAAMEAAGKKARGEA
jgi:ATP-dependent protease ClpP protease subunit